jgi:hypothetical protein
MAMTTKTMTTKALERKAADRKMKIDEGNQENGEEPEVEEPQPDDEPIPREPRRSNREPKPRQILDPSGGGKTYASTEVTSYSAVNHVITQAKPSNTFEYHPEEAHILAMAFAQTYSMNKGIKKFGCEGESRSLGNETAPRKGMFQTNRHQHVRSYNETKRYIINNVSYGETRWHNQCQECYRRKETKELDVEGRGGQSNCSVGGTTVDIGD